MICSAVNILLPIHTPQIDPAPTFYVDRFSGVRSPPFTPLGE